MVSPGYVRFASAELSEVSGADGRGRDFPRQVNWCIEKPQEGEKIDPDGPAMKALEAYAYWANRGSKLEPGRH